LPFPVPTTGCLLLPSQQSGKDIANTSDLLFPGDAENALVTLSEIQADTGEVDEGGWNRTEVGQNATERHLDRP
jgi:hypothetical protein